MKKLIPLTFFLVLLLPACSEKKIDTEKFGRVYKEILIARSTGDNSEETNAEVLDILKNAGYTEARFREEFIELSKDRKVFLEQLSKIKADAEAESDSILKARHEDKIKPEN